MELYLGQELEPALQEQEQGPALAFQRMEPPLAPTRQQPDQVVSLCAKDKKKIILQLTIIFTIYEFNCLLLDQEEDLKTQEAHQLRQQKVSVQC